jgi:hypothetical protein
VSGRSSGLEHWGLSLWPWATRRGEASSSCNDCSLFRHHVNPCFVALGQPLPIDLDRWKEARFTERRFDEAASAKSIPFVAPEQIDSLA